MLESGECWRVELLATSTLVGGRVCSNKDGTCIHLDFFSTSMHIFICYTFLHLLHKMQTNVTVVRAGHR